MAENLRSVMEDILTTYEARVKDIGDKLKEKSAQLLDRSKSERSNLIQELESILAKKVHLRKKDFRLMIQEIESYQMEREKRVKQLIEGISEEEGEIIQSLKKLLRQGKVSEAIKMVGNPGKEKLIEKELTEFEKEKGELSLQLNRLLEKSASLRVKDFKKAIKKLKARKDEDETNKLVKNLASKQQELQKEVSELLSGYRNFQHSIQNLWQKEVMRDGNS